MSNLPKRGGYPGETRINTAYGTERHLSSIKGGDHFGDLPLLDGLAAYQLVGEVTAHQGEDG